MLTCSPVILMKEHKQRHILRLALFTLFCIHILIVQSKPHDLLYTHRVRNAHFAFREIY